MIFSNSMLNNEEYLWTVSKKEMKLLIPLTKALIMCP